MTNQILYGALGAVGSPVGGVLIRVDGSLVMAAGLAVFLAGGVLLTAAIRGRRRRRVTLRHALRTLLVRRVPV